MSTTPQEEKQFLENLIEHFKLKEIVVVHRKVADKRATIGRFCFYKGSKIISPTFDFHKASAFVYGMAAYKEFCE